ncbi:MAG: PorP/SprF family type IX secretion system membrane protein, partial [Prevotellaceae bacterium]|nr:PorP/SprF family type IX secretion system membrane protein [Prevotellaceae bacterium]
MLVKKILIGILLCFTFICKVCAQFDGQFSQYMHNLCAINSANCGEQSMMQVTLMQRTQWAGFKGAPIVSMLLADTPFKIGQTEHGAGVQFLSDVFGAFNNQQVNFAYSYKFKIKENKLSAGINLGFVNIICNGDTLNKFDDISEYHKSYDPAIPSNKTEGVSFDLGFGMQYLAQKWRTGISAVHLNFP